MKIFKLAFIYKNPDTLRYVTLYIQKSRHFAKIKTICITFLYLKNPDTLRYMIFYGISEIGKGGGDIFICKKNAVCVTFLLLLSSNGDKLDYLRD